MSPKPHLRRQVIVVAAILIALAVVGYAQTALGVSLFVLLIGIIYAVLYRRFRRRDLVPRHRRELDRYVAKLVVVAAVVPALVAIVLIVVGTPFSVDAVAAQAWLTAAAVVAAAVFASSLVDWYWILPRLGGLGSWPRPCEVEVAADDDHDWRFVTQYWYGHRAVAEATAVAALAAAAIYLAGAEEHHRVIWGTIAAGAGILAAVVGVTWAQAWGLVQNPDIQVGAVLRTERFAWDPPLQELYVMDVDLRGAQPKLLTDRRRECDGERDPRVFRPKKEAKPIKSSDNVEPAPGYVPPCAEYCTGINWYCRFNPRAYDPH